MAEEKVTYGNNTILLLEDAFKQAVTAFTGEHVLRRRFRLIDEYIQRETAKTKSDAQGKFVNRYLGDRSKLQNFEVPVIQPKVDAACAYYTSTFLTSFPIFSAVGSKEMAPVAAQFHGLMGRDQNRFNWVGNLLKVHKDALKYNLCAVETVWTQKFRTESGGKGSQQIVEYEGNEIRRIDPYNMIFDASVCPSEMHTKGTFFGYVERMNYVATKGFVQGLNNKHKFLAKLESAFKSNCAVDGTSALYYEVKLRQEDNGGGKDNWGGYFGLSQSKSLSNAQGIYEVVTMYRRMVPKDFDIIAPRSGSPDVWKLIYLNSNLIYAERMGSDEFPITMTQLTDEGLGFEIKSFAENLMDSQDISTALINGRLASLRRSVSDRAIYDPRKIRSTDINTSNPEAKIPAKIGNDETLASAYYQIPYRDDMAQSFVNEFMLQQQFADDISGINKAFQGNFVKGNRTLSEFDTVMQNAQARTMQGAIILNTQLYHTVMTRSKENYIKYAVADELFDRKSRGTVAVKPEELAEASNKIQITNGLTTNSKVMNAEVLQLALSGFATVPNFAQSYDAAGMYVYMLQNMGFEDLDDFRIAPAAAGQPTGTPDQSVNAGGAPGGAGTIPA